MGHPSRVTPTGFEGAGAGYTFGTRTKPAPILPGFSLANKPVASCVTQFIVVEILITEMKIKNGKISVFSHFLSHALFLLSSLLPTDLCCCFSFQIFKDATLFFSHATPNLAMVIPAMDHIDEKLTTESLNINNCPAVRVALSLAKKTLNRYYNLTDSSEVYRIAMGAYSLLFIIFSTYNIPLKCYIPGTNLHTSRRHSGRLIG